MSSRIDGLRLRRTWGREEWFPPIPYSSISGGSKDGWLMQAKDQSGSVIVDAFDYPDREIICQVCEGMGRIGLTDSTAIVRSDDGVPEAINPITKCVACKGSGKRTLFIGYAHASISRVEQVPSYDDLVTLHRSVWGRGGWSYQYFVPEAKHVNFHPHVLHLWGRLDGSPVLPDFVDFLGGL